MRLKQAMLAVVAATLPLPAVAQTAAEAFECKLPYRATMENAAKLKVLREGKPMNMVISTMTIIELDPGATRIYGLTPDRTSILMSEPSESSANKAVSMNFQSYFAHTPTMESALLAAVKWKQPCRGVIGFCRRDGDAPGIGTLMVRFDSDKIMLECEFKVNDRDVQQ